MWIPYVFVVVVVVFAVSGEPELSPEQRQDIRRDAATAFSSERSSRDGVSLKSGKFCTRTEARAHTTHRQSYSPVVAVAAAACLAWQVWRAWRLRPRHGRRVLQLLFANPDAITAII